ncbi:hypothetical protein K439DRAFT_1619912 [Ramaria rubella]|nr:hypothetical protein K439DRAFT_1619912 [Ramaria rubella]
MDLTTKLTGSWGITIKKMTIPVKLLYPPTVNKIQGQRYYVLVHAPGSESRELGYETRVSSNTCSMVRVTAQFREILYLRENLKLRAEMKLERQTWVSFKKKNSVHVYRNLEDSSIYVTLDPWFDGKTEGFIMPWLNSEISLSHMSEWCRPELPSLSAP